MAFFISAVVRNRSSGSYRQAFRITSDRAGDAAQGGGRGSPRSLLVMADVLFSGFRASSGVERNGIRFSFTS